MLVDVQALVATHIYPRQVWLVVKVLDPGDVLFRIAGPQPPHIVDLNAVAVTHYDVVSETLDFEWELGQEKVQAAPT